MDFGCTTGLIALPVAIVMTFVIGSYLAAPKPAVWIVAATAFYPLMAYLLVIGGIAFAVFAVRRALRSRRALRLAATAAERPTLGPDPITEAKAGELARRLTGKERSALMTEVDAMERRSGRRWAEAERRSAFKALLLARTKGTEMPSPQPHGEPPGIDFDALEAEIDSPIKTLAVILEAEAFGMDWTEADRQAAWAKILRDHDQAVGD